MWAFRSHPLRLSLGLLAALLGAVVAWAAGAATAQAYAPPPANAQFDYQIGGAYRPLPTVGIVARDRLSPPAPGLFNICYVNAFQTQPGEAAWWQANHADLLVGGGLTQDPDWPGEYLFDTSTDAKRAALLTIVGGWIDRCASDGFQAVEADNLDSWTRSDGLLTANANQAFATLLAARAHADGLAIAQKNASQLAPERAAIGFDFAIAEECQETGECADFTDHYGNQVYEIEYGDAVDRADFDAACAARGATISVIRRDRNVWAPGRPGHLYEWC